MILLKIVDGLNNSGALNGTKISGDPFYQLFGDKMIKESKVGKQIGKNVAFFGAGNISLFLNDLTFHLCSSCSGIVQICYDSTAPNSALKGSCSSFSQCEIKIDGENSFIKFNDKIGVRFDETCDTLRIKADFSKINNIEIETCSPKIENGIINLVVKRADYGCRVEAVSCYL
uniref:Uncharacterized protein n=1 Tax=Panagrolaimus superbus TaxID=310955 RepID=A0A914YLQ4_9BILA